MLNKALAGALLLIAGTSLASRVTDVHSVGLTVSDLDKSIDFYTRVLSFSKLGDREVAGETYEKVAGIFGLRAKGALLRLGDEYLVLTEFYAPRGRPAPADSRSNDLWFQQVAIVVSDMDKAYDWIHNRHATFVSPNPQRIPDENTQTGGVRAFYFKDPDGHPLAILHFPEGRGDPKWHRENRSQAVFLGIDHTAITVASTDRSLKFYRDRLGMTLQGETEKQGVEQARLTNVYGAHLKITRLRAVQGLGIELHEYLAPAPCGPRENPVAQINLDDPSPCGRPYPADARPNDLIHGQTNFVTTGATEDARDLAGAGTPFVSSGTVVLSADDRRTIRAFLVRDPDGHAVFLTEK